MSDQTPPDKSGVTFKEMLEEMTGESIPDIPLFETAAHEAGHAVIAFHLGLTPIWVEINPETGRGEMTPETPWNPATPRQRLLIAQAGSAAQCRLNGIPADWTIQGVKDQLLADDLVEEEDPELEPNDFTEIEELLARPEIWARVMRLAKALEVRHRIEIPELTEFLTA
jgi:hypothetical protein